MVLVIISPPGIFNCWWTLGHFSPRSINWAIDNCYSAYFKLSAKDMFSKPLISAHGPISSIWVYFVIHILSTKKIYFKISKVKIKYFW